jgi:predicted MFS family arabinose efflux permease
MTTVNPDLASPSARIPRRTWPGVLSLALGAAIIVTTEFTPVGFLPDVAADVDVSLGAAGLMILVPGLSAAVAAPLVILGAGHLDRKNVILALGVLVALSNAIAWVAPSFLVLLLARVLLGIAIGGFWAVVPPLGFRLAGQRQGTRATSIILAGLSVGTVIGLPAGQFLGNLIGWRLTFAATAGVAVLIVVAQWALLPGLPARGRMTASRLQQVLATPTLRTILLVAGIVTVGQFAASTYVTPFLLQTAHFSSDRATLVFLGYGAAGIAGTLLIGPALVQRSRVGTFVGAALAFGTVLVVLPIVTGAPLLVGVLIVAWGVIWGLVPLALQTDMLAEAGDAPEAASAMLITAMQLSIAIGSAVGGLVVDSVGLRTVFVTSGLIAIAAAVSGLVRRGSEQTGAPRSPVGVAAPIRPAPSSGPGSSGRAA